MKGRNRFLSRVCGRFCLLFALVIGSMGSPLSTNGDDVEGVIPDAPEFNRDWYADLVVGVPHEDIGTAVQDGGSVNVLYGRSGGLAASGSQSWDQSFADIIGNSQTDDHFGAALAVGDFNGDHFRDLAVGVPGEEVGGHAGAGAVNVLYGGTGGLSAAGDQFWTQDTPDVDDQAEAQDQFGFALVAGDFDGNGYDDLAVGLPYENIGALGDAGAVHVFYGSNIGLSVHQVRADQFWNQNSTGINDEAAFDDHFGYALAVGDFDGDGYDDLAIGAPGEDFSGREGTGAISILYGGSQGLSATGNQFIQQDVLGGIGPETGDAFGSSLAAGDFNGNGYCDLAVGVPREDVGNPVVVDAGGVNVLRGTSAGIVPADSFWSQDRDDIGDIPQEDDHFGLVLTSADFNGDGYADLAVGVPHEDMSAADTGIVQVVYGSNSYYGLQGSDQLFSQAVVGEIERAGDQFGAALAAGDFDADGFADLVVGVPFKDFGSPVVSDAGRVHIIPGGSPRLKGSRAQIWYQGKDGSAGKPELADDYGLVLAAYPGILDRVFLPMILRRQH